MGMKMGKMRPKMTKKGQMGDDMYNMDTKPVKKMGGGMMNNYAKGGSVSCRGNGMARGKKTKMY